MVSMRSQTFGLMGLLDLVTCCPFSGANVDAYAGAAGLRLLPLMKNLSPPSLGPIVVNRGWCRMTSLSVTRDTGSSTVDAPVAALKSDAFDMHRLATPIALSAVGPAGDADEPEIGVGLTHQLKAQRHAVDCHPWQ